MNHIVVTQFPLLCEGANVRQATRLTQDFRDGNGTIKQGLILITTADTSSDTKERVACNSEREY